MAINKKKGIILLICSAFFFALMNVFVRLSGDLPTFQKAFFRNIIAAILGVVLVLRDKSEFFPKDKNKLINIILRTLFGLTGVICNFYCVDHMILADASVLNKLSPFFAILFSFIIIKEKPRVYQWIFVFGAFVGSVFVIKPSFSNADFLPGLIGFAGGACAGIAYAFVRKLGTMGVKSSTIVFFFSFCSTIVLLPLMIINYQHMEIIQWIYLLFAGLSAAVAQICITNAYSFAPAKEISIYDYTQIIFSSILGLIIFLQVPDILSIIGYIVIVIMAILNFILNSK